MKQWVFRVPKSSGGDPDNYCPISLKSEAISTGLEAPQSIIKDYTGCLVYVLNELFGLNESKRNRLRQGWGIPTTDLRFSESVWIENYITACYRYWGKYPDGSSCEQASGRRKILIHMEKMNKDDIIYLPNVKKLEVDHSCFSVCRVRKSYYFEDRSQYPSTWEKDFGHIVEVKDIKTFYFNKPDTLPKSVFGAPYLHAIDPVKDTYDSFPVLNDFAKYYLKSLKIKKT